MTNERADQLIQLILAPSVTLTACGVLVSGVLARYAGVHERIRAMLAERWAMLGNDPEANPRKRTQMEERLRQLDLQLPLLLRRHRMLRRAAMILYAALLLVVMSMVLMALGVFLPMIPIGNPAIVGFLLGTGLLVAGLGQVVHETKLSDDAVRLEAERVLTVPLGVAPGAAMTDALQVVGQKQTVLGEGVRWDADRQELLWVDIQAGELFGERLSPDGTVDRIRTYAVGTTLGAASPVEGGDGYVLAAGRGFAHLTQEGRLTWMAEPAPLGSRMNDGACDPQGRFWAGAMSLTFRRGEGALYVLEPEGSVRCVLEKLTLPNGIGWSPDGAVMYLADSLERVIWAFTFNGATGSLSEQRALVEIGEGEGVPDGLTVDARGDLWVAMYDGGCVRRYASGGQLRERVLIPTAQVTSCGFGGPALDTLFVITATEHWTEEQRRAEPLAGRLYKVPTRTRGIAARTFRGHRAAASA